MCLSFVFLLGTSSAGASNLSSDIPLPALGSGANNIYIAEPPKEPVVFGLLYSDRCFLGRNTPLPLSRRLLCPCNPQIRYKQSESRREVLPRLILGRLAGRVIDAVAWFLRLNSVLRQLFRYLSGALQVYQYLFHRQGCLRRWHRGRPMTYHRRWPWLTQTDGTGKICAVYKMCY